MATIGIRNGSLRLGYEETIVQAGELGFDGVELNIAPDYADSLLWSDEGRARLRHLSEQYTCDILSLCVGALWKISPASDDEAVRTHARTIIDLSASVAASVGATWILVPITPGGDDVPYETNVERWLEVMAAAAPEAEERGVIYCLENVGRGCGRSAEELIRLADGVDSPAVQVYYDIGNAIHFEFDPIEEIDQLGDRIQIVHIKDHADRLGGGPVPVASCLRHLMRGGYNGPFVFETNATGQPDRAAAHNLGYVRGILDALETE